MKRFRSRASRFGTSLFLCALGMSASSAVEAKDARRGGRSLIAEPRQGEKIRIDGDLREWPARMTPLSEVRSGGATEARTVIGYDDENIYLVLRAADKRIARTGAARESEDHATLTLAFPSSSGEYTQHEVEVFPGNPGRLPAVVKLGGQTLAGAKAVENVVDKDLLLEAQIPWKSFPQAQKTRVGLRAAVTYTNADAPGSVKSVVSTSSGRTGRSLSPLLLEGEQGLSDLWRDKNLSDVPAREAYGNLSGDPEFERVAVFGPYITISGPKFRGGKEIYFSELGVSGADMVTRLSLTDFDGDGRDEIVVKKRVGSSEKYRELLEVLKLGRDDAPFTAFAHEVGIKTEEGSISNKLKISSAGIEIAQGEKEGFEPESYAEPLPARIPSALLPWESVASRSFKWQGKSFSKVSEEKQAGKSGPKPVQKTQTDDAEPAAVAPRAPSADELQDRLYALYRKDRGVGGGKPRFDFVADVTGDATVERVLVHDRDLLVFGKGFRKGTSYSFITLGVADAKDIAEVTARDLTGDGKAEILVKGVLHAKASKALGGDVVDRHALFVYGIRDDKVARVFAAETARVVGKNQIQGSLSFQPAERGVRIELKPGRAVGWTESSYPFPQDTTTAGGLEPLLLPWTSTKRRYRFDGSTFVTE